MKYKIAKKNSFETFNEDLFRFKNGIVYLFVAFNYDIISLKKTANNACWVNFPFIGAMKILPYIAKSKNVLSNIIDEINDLDISEKKINEFGFYDKIVIVLFMELKFNKKIFVETSGLDESSIIRLMKFCLKLVNVYKGKSIIIVESANSDENRSVLINTVDEYLIDKIVNNGMANFIISDRP